MKRGLHNESIRYTHRRVGSRHVDRRHGPCTATSPPRTTGSATACRPERWCESKCWRGDFDAISVGDHLPLQWIPGDPSHSTLGDGASVGVFSWIFALLVAALSALGVLGSGIGVDAANERADRLAVLLREDGLTCPHCGANRKDHTYHRRDQIAFAYFFICEECQADLKPADFRS